MPCVAHLGFKQTDLSCAAQDVNFHEEINSPLPTGTIFKHIPDIIITHLTMHEKAMPPAGHVFKPTGTIFVLVQDIIGTNLLTKFHEDRAINVASRLLTKKMPRPPPWCQCFSTNRNHFKLVQDIIRTNLLTKKNAPHPGGNVFQPTATIFELNQDIIGTNRLTNFHARRTTDKRRSQKLTMNTGIVIRFWGMGLWLFLRGKKLRETPDFGEKKGKS
ncbi:hypothetical protein DPMN_168835 [Dreissena polymorpha]|uniref:Uncharacterized protein n=1 Tax=Dreissena polymorpha TaxID=45954 RepID=A0A9D4F1F5_DREPO|nr:hypothetical protein DPMN_168835 [Dreissena polymorpha]